MHREVRITDDGVEFTAPGTLQSGRGHLGLSAMREPAEMAGGWCRLLSLPGAGTTVEIWVPGSAPPPPRDLEGNEGDISAERETAALELAAADDR